MSEDILAAQLVRLASQHHTSEYNRMKFGPNGSPMTYVPYSIQMPEMVKQLQEQQARCAEKRSWWPCRSKEHVSDSATFSNDSTRVSASLCHLSTSLDLQREISAAMSSTLSTVCAIIPPHPALKPQIKTSESHPLNISAIIPLQLLPSIASRIDKQSPIPLDLSPNYLLDILSSPPAQPQHTDASLPPPSSFRSRSALSVSTSFEHRPAPARPAKLASFLWSYPSLRRALQSATGSAVEVQGATSRYIEPAVSSTQPHRTRESRSYSPPNEAARERAVNLYGSSASIDKSDDEKLLGPNHRAMPIIAALQHKFPATSPAFHSRPRPCTPISLDVLPTKELQPPLPSMRQQPPTTQPLGNLFLSSCPGKKVRLNGPINGRSSICRDLRQDLQRLKELGAGCIVCCLDDGELDMLGAPWSEYSRIADELGIDVLRIPIPEGLAPTDPALLDAHLTRLIYTYTLRGIPILVHCRGGVGRAGIVACCWLLKLGICGRVAPNPSVGSGTAFTAPEDLPDVMSKGAEEKAESEIREDTMNLVERAIGVVRRRRSPKAVETYEQVKFLVDYVELLRERRHAVDGAGVDPLEGSWDTQID